MFGERFRKLRKERRYSQLKVASDLNVAQSTIASWEAGVRSPNMDMIPQLAEYFGVSVDYLLDLSENPVQAEQPSSSGAFTTTIPQIVMMGREMEKMTPEQRDQMLAVGKALFREFFGKGGEDDA